MELLGLTREALADWLDDVGVGRTHASTVFAALHRHRDLNHAEAAIGPLNLRTLHERGELAQAAIESRHTADDGSTRLVFRLVDGARVEGVLLPSRHGPKATLCLSSQVGCAMGCRFCATGTLGLTRHLTAGEMLAQVHQARSVLAEDGVRLSHLVFMGMGEPLHNLPALTDALSILIDRHGDPMTMRNITVSTVGLVDALHRFYEQVDGRFQLALSLHAGTDSTRQKILPMARKYSMAQLREALLANPNRGHRWMLEYVLLPGVNDSDAEFDALAEWIDGLPAMVNIIPFNPFAGSPYRSPTPDEVESAWKRMKARRIPNTVRRTRGREAHGACGQLMLEGEPEGVERRRR